MNMCTEYFECKFRASTPNNIIETKYVIPFVIAIIPCGG